MSDVDGSVLTGNPDGDGGNWAAGLDDYQDTIRAKGWTGPEDLLKSYVNLESQVGLDKVVLPSDDEDLREWEGWSKLGTPASADDYELGAPDGFEGYSEELSNWFREAAHDMKLPASMAQGLHDRFVENMMGQYEGAQTAQADQQAQWEGELQKEFGNAFDQRVEAARRAVRTYGSPELQELLATSGLGSNPHVVRAFSKMGMALGSGPQFKEGETSGQFGTTPDSAKEQIAAIRANPGYFDSSHPEHRALKDKMTRLADLAYGTDAVAQNISVG